ncbi:MAG TPA: DNA-formamidopyrimidine glycosylase family protein [Streptosporangiaceae bacterium]|jgi:endonuclease-8
MPEGDTVWHTARVLRDALAGHELLRSDFRVPSLATVDLAGRTVDDVVPRGKHLLTRVAGGLTIHTHLKMEGVYRIVPAGRPVRDHRVRLVLATASRQAVGVSLGVVELLPTAEEHRVVGHLGPDPLGPDWDAEEAVRRLLAEPDRPIGSALLDQRNLAGVGNVYKSEALFLAGVHPETPVRDVRRPAAVADLARRLLEANRDRVKRVTTGDRRRGAELWVYGRWGLPCRRCGTPVAGAGSGGGERVTYWCPACQPGG